jgi:hypothetical protein
MEVVQIEVTVGLDLGLCLQGHTNSVGDFSTFVGVYKDKNNAHNKINKNRKEIDLNTFPYDITLKALKMKLHGFQLLAVPKLIDTE